MRMSLGLEAVHVGYGVRLRLRMGVRLRLEAVRLHRRRLRLLSLHVPQQPGFPCSGRQHAPKSTSPSGCSTSGWKCRFCSVPRVKALHRRRDHATTTSCCAPMEATRFRRWAASTACACAWPWASARAASLSAWARVAV